MYKRVLVPLSGSEAKGVMSRPVSEVGHRFDVVRTTPAKRPDTDHFNSGLCRLTQRFRHARAIVVAIHDRHVRANKPKRTITDKKPAAALTHKRSGKRVRRRIRRGGQKKNC